MKIPLYVPMVVMLLIGCTTDINDPIEPTISPGTPAVPAVPPAPSIPAPAEYSDGRLLISFRVIESEPGYYAPVVTVTELLGKSGVEVVGLRFTIPGLAGGWHCRGGVNLDPHGSRNMFDADQTGYQLVFTGFWTSTSPAAFVEVFARDGAGTETVTGITGPITSRDPAETFTGTLKNYWECGGIFASP